MHRITLFACCLVFVSASVANTPFYKPSARAPEAMDITENAYGYSQTAPDALRIGELAPEFDLPGPTGAVKLSSLRAQGEVVIVFYRGHW